MTEEWFSGWGQLAEYSTLQHNWLNGDFLDEVTRISVCQDVNVSQSSIVTHFHLPSKYGWWLYLGTEKLARWKRHWFKWDGDFWYDRTDVTVTLCCVCVLNGMRRTGIICRSVKKILHMDCSGKSLHETMIAIESRALQVCSPVKGAVSYAEEEMQGGWVPVIAKVRI